MSSLQILQGTFRLSDTKTLQLPQLTLNAGDSWAFVGSNGSGKSALARALAGELPLLKGERQSQFSHITRLSFEQLQKLVSDEWQRNNTDMLGPGEDDTGRTTAEIIQDEVKDAPRCMQLAQQFGIYSAAIFLIPICISFDTAEKRRYATYLILNRRFSFEF